MCSSLQRDIRVRGTELSKYQKLNIDFLPTSVGKKIKTPNYWVISGVNLNNDVAYIYLHC